MSLQIKKLQVNIADEDRPVLTEVSLEIAPGEVHVLMGPNGSGKSTLSKVLMGHHDYVVISGEIWLDDEEITSAETTDRARKGLFLAAQYPVEIPGVNLANFLRVSYNSMRPESEKLPLFKFRKLLREKLAEVGLPESFMERNLHEGFSGGEKKKCEILQMLLLEPKYVVLDETDSGLDVDAIRTVFTNLAKAINTHKQMGVLLITHYHRVFEYIHPDFVHIFKNGKIVETGGLELAQRIDTEGYESKS